MSYRFSEYDLFERVVIPFSPSTMYPTAASCWSTGGGLNILEIVKFILFEKDAKVLKNG